MDNIFQINKPYPQPVGLAENKRVARLLLKSYCGTCSEMTSVNQYMYHYLKAIGGNAHVPDALRAIAEVELRHLYLLGSLIRQLGVNPKLRTIGENGPNYWDASKIEYGRNVKEMLALDIAQEQESIRQYEHALRRIDNTQISALIARILEDERLHLQILNDIWSKYF